MTDALLLGIIGVVPPTLIACGGLILAIKTYAEAKTISGHVNSEKTELLGKLAAKDIEIALHKERINDLRSQAGLLAQAAAGRVREAMPVVVPIVPVAPAESTAVVESLHKIDNNTAVIAENTAAKEPT